VPGLTTRARRNPAHQHRTIAAFEQIRAHLYPEPLTQLERNRLAAVLQDTLGACVAALLAATNLPCAVLAKYRALTVPEGSFGAAS
jgi:hypothetical protein